MYKYLFLVVVFWITACATDQDTRPQKKTNEKPPLAFIHDENDTHHLVLESDPAIYLEEEAIVEQYIAKMGSKGIRTYHLYFRDRDQVFIYIQRFPNLSKCLEYKTQIDAANLFDFDRTFIPISMRNYRILLSKKTTFAKYMDFYRSSVVSTK